MEIIRENFESLLPEVRDAIRNCSFMAIDTELTGLRISETKENYFDSMEERYQFIRQTSKKYLIIQFGLVTFFYDEATDSFTHKAYNFYTYPSQTKNFVPTVYFMCESSSIEFLSSFGFDFNKLFHHGIPYLSQGLVKNVIEDHEAREAKYEQESQNSRGCPVPEQYKKFMDETKATIKRFAASQKKEHTLDSLSPFQRRLVFENLKPIYPNLLFETVNTDDEDTESISEGDTSDIDETTGSSKSKSSSSFNILSSPVTSKKANDELPKSMADLSLPTTVKQKAYKKPLKVTKVSEQELQQRKEEKKLKFEKDVDSMVGFSKVIDEIGKSGKIVVGHNMLLDVSHAVNQFIDDLPGTLPEFKNMVQTCFPNLVDTKLMASQLPFRELFKSSVLSEVLKRLETEPFALEDSAIHTGESSKGYNLSQGKYHEAGYDAYITGLCFISMCKYLGTLQEPKKTRVLPESPLVMPYINKLFLMRMMDISYMNISGSDLTPSRSHVFFVKCPKNTTVDSIRDWFSPFGQIQCHWQGDDIFVSLGDKDQAPLVLRNLELRDGFSVITYEQYSEQKQKENEKSSTSVNNNGTESDSSPTMIHTKRPKTDKPAVKRKPAVKPPELFEQPPDWD